MTMRFGSIIIHKAGEYRSESDSNGSSCDDAELAEIAETATLRYNKPISTRRLERRRNMAKVRNDNIGKQSSTSFFATGTNELPILQILNPDKSSPVFRSHYSPEAQVEKIQGKEYFHSAEDNDRLGFKILTSGSRTTNNAIHQRRVSFNPDVKLIPTYSHVIEEEGDDRSLRGLSRLLKNLNFTERLRHQKTDQERLNVHKLPNHMKEQLKHIYVY